jgi:diguanylate cyclase (GGDEF)-like protein
MRDLQEHRLAREVMVVVVRDRVAGAEAVAGVGAVPGREVRATPAGWWARRRADWASWLPLALGLVVVVGFFALPHGSVAQAAVIPAMCAADSVAAFVAAVRARGLARVVWLWHAVGLLALTAGVGLIRGYPFVTGHPAPSPSLADALILGLYPCLAVALWALARLCRGEDHRGDLLDVIIIVGGVGALMWVLGLGPAVHMRGVPLATHVVAVSYTAADLLVFAMLVRLLVGSRRSGAMRMLAAAAALLPIADIVLAVQMASGSPVLGAVFDGLCLSNCVLMIAAAVHPTARTFTASAPVATHRLSPSRMVFLGAALLVFPILFATRPDDVVLIAALSVLTLAAVIARMARLNRRLDVARRGVEEKSAQLRHQALHDALTGLPNRALIMDRLEHLLARSRRHTSSVPAAMFIDLDGFKDVNDTLGHEVGDKLLQAVAERLRGSLRDADTIGRLGGDEFVILLDGATVACAPELVAERIVNVIGQPFELAGCAEPIRVTTSIGITTGPAAAPGELLRDADMALYEAKAAGKNCYAVFQPETQTVVQRRHEVEQHLRSALEADQFRLVYQPIYGLEELDIVGFEALLRWEHPTLGLVEPAEIIPVLESTGQILEVGRWVLREACAQMATWRAGGHDLIVSVNVSARQLDRGTIIEHVREALAASGLAPTALTLEITETSLMRDVDAAVRRLHQLKALGVQIAIDDFGTGYSSLAHLERLPVDSLKIDRAFTDAVTRSPGSGALIHTLVQLGKELGLKTLAEGVETTTQIDHLRAENVNEVQGFLLAQPLTAADIEARLLAPIGIRSRSNRHPRPGDRLPQQGSLVADQRDDSG